MDESFNKIESLENVALKKLLALSPKLKELGLTPCDRFFNLETLQNPTSEFGFPIVEDGLNGIRVSYKKGNLTLWFTNNFEDENNETRKKVQEIWNSLN